MNDIKTIEELMASHRQLKGVVTALKRLEEWLDAQGRKDAQSGTDDTPPCGGRTLKTRVNTKGPKGQRIKGSSPPQARVFNPERNELKNRFAGSSCPDRLQCNHHSEYGTKRSYRLPKPTRNNRSSLHS
jgi:hypothetical protein